MGWTLSIDYGTTNTTAAVRTGTDRPRAVPLGPGGLLPSAALLTSAGIRVGAEAVAGRHAAPEHFVSSPKLLLGQDTLLLGDTEVEVVDLVAQTLAHATRAAVREAGGSRPDKVVLTHPQTWARPRREALRAAWRRTGSDLPVELVSEPIAAVSWFADGADLPDDAHVAVLDFGGGTCDVAVLRHRAGSGTPLEITAHAGLDDLGGSTVDHVFALWVRAQLRQQGLGELDDALGERAHLGSLHALYASVQAAKHALADWEYADVDVALGDRQAAVTVTINEFNQVIAGEMQRARALLERSLEAAGVEPDGLHALYLTGGSSRLRWIHRMATELLAGRPAHLAEPHLVVAYGAHTATDVVVVQRADADVSRIITLRGLQAVPDPRSRLTKSQLPPPDPSRRLDTAPLPLPPSPAAAPVGLPRPAVAPGRSPAPPRVPPPYAAVRRPGGPPPPPPIPPPYRPAPAAGRPQGPPPVRRPSGPPGLPPVGRPAGPPARRPAVPPPYSSPGGTAADGPAGRGLVRQQLLVAHPGLAAAARATPGLLAALEEPPVLVALLSVPGLADQVARHPSLLTAPTPDGRARSFTAPDDPETAALPARTFFGDAPAWGRATRDPRWQQEFRGQQRGGPVWAHALVERWPTLGPDERSRARHDPTWRLSGVGPVPGWITHGRAGVSVTVAPYVAPSAGFVRPTPLTPLQAAVIGVLAARGCFTDGEGFASRLEASRDPRLPEQRPPVTAVTLGGDRVDLALHLFPGGRHRGGQGAGDLELTAYALLLPTGPTRLQRAPVVLTPDLVQSVAARPPLGGGVGGGTGGEASARVLVALTGEVGTAPVHWGLQLELTSTDAGLGVDLARSFGRPWLGL
ncbi:Hsp70 family protein [Nocardioides alkalitolerans]|uniref:Hsp70 family protein n=1 Tax=Nocardioides alkalitolerans TaxID=281714 RepID=UPI000409EE7A|nr:Hsp70 family protein [Nocardioides alkalitolerans]